MAALAGLSQLVFMCHNLHRILLCMNNLNELIILFLLSLSLVVQAATGCHVLPEKATQRENLCEGPQLELPDVGPCGTEHPRYLEDLSFKVFFPWAEKHKHYVLLMVDPDAPMKDFPLLGDYVHWLLADIPGMDLLSGIVSPLQATELIVYQPPSPPPDSGPHRYQLFLFESPEDAAGADLVGYNKRTRAKLDLERFILANGMCYMLRATFQFSYSEKTYPMSLSMHFP